MGEGAQEFNRGEMKQKFKKEGGGLHEFKRFRLGLNFLNFLLEIF